VITGLALNRALWIVQVPQHGQSDEAFTTNTIQSGGESSTFLLNGKRDTGVALEPNSFTVTNPTMNENGVVYHWSAHGEGV
jgi:hypothetical protein